MNTNEQIIISTFSDLSNEDIYEIMKLRVDIFVVEQNCPYPELDNNDQKAWHLYIKKDGNIVSYARILFKDSSAAIGRVVTHKSYRGLGLSQMILKEAIETIKTNTNYTKIHLSAQCYILDLYKKLGFKVVSDQYLEDNIPHVDMELKIPKLS
ncbi:GNAT family N-acetyltransferase [Proteinivorax hydrogeniformans]|uniref:GNAT family N-acetyltransferase n=1 Tax=Proteinivorax hydrogeniformans TaxID=1826727 RepID=A0AAU8HSK6_9FIRM